jgi:predicted enzyme related to lactoylglutathione lyase
MPRVDSYETGVPCWVDLSTTDPDDAVRFYTTVFGWGQESLPSNTEAPYHMFTKDGAHVAACMRQSADLAGAGVPSSWTTYLAGNADEVAERVPHAGGQVIAAPFDIGGTGRMAIISDPTGAVLGVWQAGSHSGAQLVNEPGCLTWNEVNTTDMEATARFLEQVFGVETSAVPAVESGYKTFEVAGVPRGGILQMTEEWEGIPPHWMAYFAVEDTDATCAAVEAAGGKVSVPPFDSDFGRMAVLSDPQGAVFMVSSQPA